MNSGKIENIIFDLGGVVINLDMEHTFDWFSQLFGRDVRSNMMDDVRKHHFFMDFEIGKISAAEFRDGLRKLTHTEIEDARLDKAWNAMLGDIPKERTEWIEELKQDYNVVILSNTNSIHIEKFNEIFGQTTPYHHPEDLFHKVYYSHEIKDRKPNRSCFQHVLDDFGMKAECTIFYDDNLENTKAARALGIQSVLVEKNFLRKEQLPNGRKQ